jgi:predicted dehydrogenase
MTSLSRQSVLVIGAGSIGERHLRCLLRTGRAEVRFVETNDVLAMTIAKRYPEAVLVKDFDAALGDDIDAAVIATPAATHVPLAMKLVDAGVDVLIEKPLAISYEGVEDLRDAVRMRNAVAGVAYVYRAHPAFAEMRAAIISGRFGRPLEIVAVCGQHFPTYRPAYSETYYASRVNGGGAVQDALTHIINAGEWLVGPIDQVVADAAHQSLERVTVEDTVHVIARHGSVLGSYSLNQHQTANEVTITVICQGGIARFEYHACRWRSMEREAPNQRWNDHSFGPLQQDELFAGQANMFLDAIRDRSAPLCALDEGILTLRSNIAILRSIEERTWQKIERTG